MEKLTLMWNNFIKSSNAKSILFICIIAFILTSCFKGSIQGLSSGYENKKDLIEVEFVDNLSPNSNNEILYAMNGKTLKNELMNYNNSLIYIWSPNCHSDVCVPPKSVQEYCNQNNIELFVILEYYDEKVNDFIGTTKNPILIADHFYYQTNLVNKYNKLFLEDVLGFKPESKDPVIWNRYLFLEKGKFIQSKEHIFKK